MKRINIIIFSLLIPLFICFSFPTAAQYDPEIYQAQKSLKAQGYNPGTPDGLWGKATEKAVKYFQVDNELPVTGKLDEQTKAKLGIVSSIRSMKRNQQAQERRLALVIGNSSYKSAPLRNPANDANDMARMLERIGFEVILKTNANKRTMLEAINQFGKSLRNAEVGLFFYAGHGMQVNRLNYLIPIGAYVTDETDVEIEGVDARRILGRMETAANDVNIIFLDACRDNPFQRSFRSTSRGLVKMDAPKGTFIAYATSPGDVAEDGRERNSPFTKHVLRNITVPDIPIEKMMKKVRRGVLSETNDKQMPWQASSLTGDFYFASPTSDIAPEPQASTQLADERAKLERERQELERLKLEFERKKLEAERKRFEEDQKKETVVASIDPKGREIVRDGHYIAYASGVVRDTKTGLEWVAGPDRDTNWNEAKRWVENLNIAGGGWRMPNRDELESLYQKEKGSRNMTPLLKTTGWYVWSGETKGFTSAWTFTFSSGRKDWLTQNLSYNDGRAFAVRSRPSSGSQSSQEETQRYATISPDVSKQRVISKDDTLIQGELRYQDNKWKTIIVEGEQVFVRSYDRDLDTIKALEEKRFSESISFSINNQKDMQPMLIKAKGKLVKIGDQWYARFEYLNARINRKVRDSSDVNYISVGLVWYYKRRKYHRWYEKYQRTFSMSGTIPYSGSLNGRNSFNKKLFWIKLTDRPLVRGDQIGLRAIDYTKLIKPHIYVAFHSKGKNYTLTTSKRR